MGRAVLIRFQTDQTYEEARAKVEQLLRITTEVHEATFGGEPLGKSYLFSTLGIDGAIYQDQVSGQFDQRLVGFDFVIDVGLYGKLTGRMYDELDALGLVAEIVGSLVSAQTGWSFFVCTEDEHVIE